MPTTKLPDDAFSTSSRTDRAPFTLILTLNQRRQRRGQLASTVRVKTRQPGHCVNILGLGISPSPLRTTRRVKDKNPWKRLVTCHKSRPNLETNGSQIMRVIFNETEGHYWIKPTLISPHHALDVFVSQQHLGCDPTERKKQWTQRGFFFYSTKSNKIIRFRTNRTTLFEILNCAQQTLRARSSVFYYYYYYLNIFSLLLFF